MLTATHRRSAANGPGCLVLLVLTCAIATAQNAVNQRVSPDLFGELVDVVTPGFLHWSKAGGDTVDPDADANDFDNNFGEHNGAVDVASYSSQARAYAAGTVAEEFAYADASSSIRWEFTAPGPGQYVLVARPWRELQETTDVVISYRTGDEWIDLPAARNVDHWGGYSDLTCFLIEVPDGQGTVPVRIQAASGRCLVFRTLLGRRRDDSPFVQDARPTHPSMHFTARDIPALREKVKAGPAKLAFDYMTPQLDWYRNTLNRNEKSWTPKGSSHHVPRSVAQTAFMYVLTQRRELLDDLVRMLDTVMDWERNENAILDQKAGFNILGRARVLSAMAMAYDWTFDDLPARKRRRLRRFLDEEANRLYLFNETVVGDARSHNWDPWIAAGYGMAGIALRDEHKWAQDWIDSAKRILRVNLHRGGEDFGYFNNGFTKALDFAISLFTATGEDLITPQAEWVRSLLELRMTLLTPQRDGYPQFGDARGGNDPVLALCMTRFLRDPLAQWYLNHTSCGGPDTVKAWGWNHMMPVAVVTQFDGSLEEGAPGLPRLPLARSFANLQTLTPGIRGVTVMRTGFDRAADVQLAIRCGEFGGWHGHPDQGSPVLNAYGDHLVIDRALGAPYGTDKSNFSKTALAHSTVLVDEKGQVDYSSPVFHDREAGHTGPLLHTDFVDHVLCDTTVAYRKNKRLRAMREAHRHYLFVRKPDRHAYIVLFDDLDVDDKFHAFDWLLQTDRDHTVTTASANHHVLTGQAELHVYTIEPKQVESETSDHFGLWRTLKLMNPDDARRGQFVNILYPRTADMPLLEVERIEGEGHVGVRVGTDDLFLFATAGEPIDCAGITTDGRIAAVGRDANTTKWYLCVGGTRMRVDGEQVFGSSHRVTVGLDATRSGTVVNENAEPATLSIGTGAGRLQVESGTNAVKDGQVR